MQKIILIVAGIIVFGVLAVMGSTYFLSKPQKYTGPVEKITLAVAPFEVSALIWIAENKGYFTDNGLEVTITSPVGGPETVSALRSGTAGVAVLGEYGFISNNAGNDLRILGAIDAGDTNNLVVRKDRGIRQPSDLKGKTIGVIRKIEPDFYLSTFLTLNGLKESDVKFFDLTSVDTIDSIINGTVDAVMTYEPNVTKIKEKLGENAIIWPGQSGQPYYAVLISKQDFIASHEPAIEKLLRSLVQAEEFLRNNPNESKEIVRKRLNYEQTYLSSVWSKHHFGVSLNQSLLVLMENETRWAIANKLTDKTTVSNFTDFIYKDALRKVKLEAVTLY